MRTIVQRFAALAMAIALVFGSVSMVSAQVPGDDAPGTDDIQVNLDGDRGTYLALEIDNTNIDFGTVDAYGVNPNGYTGVEVCDEAQDVSGGAFYASDTVSTVNIISDSDYTVSATTTASDSFYVDRHDQLYPSNCDAIFDSVAALNNDSPTTQPPSDPQVGRDEYYYWGLEVFSEDLDSDLDGGVVTITYTGRAL